MAAPNGMEVIGSNPGKDDLGAFRRLFEKTRLIPDFALPILYYPTTTTVLILAHSTPCFVRGRAPGVTFTKLDAFCHRSPRISPNLLPFLASLI